MNSAPAHDRLASLNIRDARVSTVALQRVPPDRVETFLACQRGLTQAAEGFPGYQGTDLYPPPDGRHLEWVAVVHFDDHESLQLWIDSAIRGEWTKKLQSEVGEFQLRTPPGGFGSWFASLLTGPKSDPPPSWKMAMTVLLGLYPTVMMIALLVGRQLRPLGMAMSMLISNTLSVAITQWVVVPPLTNVLGPWLYANTPDKQFFSIGGTILIWLLLGCLVVLFRVATG